ncbi:MAG: copper homeostasis protein CutC [Lewinella sp.]|nr:copper homeostasis protein CutC [Lewinella sp.]
MTKTLEICVDSVTAALTAAAAGADRIELCENLAQGGVTPSAGKIRLAKAALSIPVFVLVRPRPGDFHYSPAEFDLLLLDIEQAKALGADGIVAGLTGPDGELDEDLTARLVAAANPLPLTFHRAFDHLRDPLAAIDTLARLQVVRILTAGGQGQAADQLDQLQRYLDQAAGRLEILAGGGVRPHNIGALTAIPGLREFHSAARMIQPSPVAHYAKAQLGFSEERIQQELKWATVDPEMIRAMKRALTD